MKSVCRLLVGSAVLVCIVTFGGKKIDHLSYSVANSIVNNDKKAITVALVQEYGKNPVASYDRRAYAYKQAKDTYRFTVATATSTIADNQYALTEKQNIFTSKMMNKITSADVAMSNTPAPDLL